MRFNIKLLNYKRIYIHFCILALLNIFFSTENIQAKTFSVNEIEISAPFEIDFNKNNIKALFIIKFLNKIEKLN